MATLPTLINLTNQEFQFSKMDYLKSLGVLCKAEYEFQKATLIPLRVRLGSLDYTNYLEQKPNALKPN